MKELVLIDGNSLLYRAYYATAAMGNLMMNKDGIPTNAVFGFANMLESVLKGNPEYLVVAFDYGKKTFRNDLFEVYKGTRSATPDELVCQFSMIREYLTAHGIKYQEVEGYEGDDVIGTIATLASKNRFKVSIVTSDKDMLQLVTDEISVYLTKKGVGELEKITPAKFKEMYGLIPDQMRDLKGLMGDKSDNIPGIPGVGEKTALKLLKQYHTVENLNDHLDELKERGISCYVQYSLNDYEDEKLEKGVPPLPERIDTFKRLVDKLGLGGVIWRFDPLMLTDDINIDKLLRKIERIGEQLKGYTEKLVFSFADISIYRKVKSNLEANGIPYYEWRKEQMDEFAKRLVKLNKDKGWNYELATCGEKGRYEGIKHNSCIDDVLIIRRAYRDKELMKYLKVEPVNSRQPSIPGLDYEHTNSDSELIRLDNGQYVNRGNNRDSGQREFCGCMKSKDIGQYNTCIHMCEYCYANTSKEVAEANYKRHLENPWAETITGR